MQKSSEFIYLFKPKRENFLQTMTQEEMAAFGGHSEYTEKLFAEGKVILMGGCLDGAYGIVIFRAESTEEAQQIFKNDPAVKAGIVHAELHPYQVTARQGC
ncbi:MAG: YciI family protein [Clostridia bacterium]|nr:YciI family protein [Clostridia bacterium]